MLSNLRFLFLVIFATYFSKVNGQGVTGVEYYMEYNQDDCWYDCYFIVTEGSATNIGERTQFGAQYTIVTPTGTTLSVSETYMPLTNNQFYGGTVPANWNLGTPAVDVGGIDITSVFPTVIPSAQYNNLSTGDTIKIFSLEVDGLSTCNDSIVRLYENGVDPNFIDGSDFRNGFPIGAPPSDYDGNADVIGTVLPTLNPLLVDLTSGIFIDLEIDFPTCYADPTFAWTGPSGYTSTTEDVVIDPTLPSDFGAYKVVVSDQYNCQDSLEVFIEDPDATPPAQVLPLILENVKLTPTFEHIAAHISILGDDNHNSTVSIEYRLTGASDYLAGSLTMRAFPEMIVDGQALGLNFHAGSAMHLQPNSTYDIKITITDPDGGSQVVEQTLTTREFPSEQGATQVKYVIPGNGGGDGTQSNPYQGLQTAADNATPGMLFEVGDGVYQPFDITVSGTEDMPIIWKSTNLHGASIDGGNTSTGIITVGTFDDSLRYQSIDGFEIKNGHWAVDAQNTQYFTVQNNLITDVDFGIYNRRENGWEHDQYIHNNHIVGRVTWPQTDGSIPAERGIDIRGNANVVSYNTVTDFGDGISTDGQLYQTSYALDIHHNDVNRVVDDLIEVDGTISNTRVYNNRGYNGRVGVSLAPVFGGPAYVFRNEFYNMETSVFKLNRGSAGLVIINNSASKTDRGMTSPSGWQNTIFKNNALLSSNYVFEEFGLVNGSADDWDHNGYFSLRAGTAGEPWFKWDDIRYNDITSLTSSGVTEPSSIAASLSDFVDVQVPASYAVEALHADVDFDLSMTSGLIDQGVSFDNILYVPDGQVDIGVYEEGQVLPHYGHAFGSVCSRLDILTRTWNGQVSNAWYHPDNWTPCGVPIDRTKVIIPGGLSRYPNLNTDVKISNLDILDGGQLEIPTETTLQLTNQ